MAPCRWVTWPVTMLSSPSLVYNALLDCTMQDGLTEESDRPLKAWLDQQLLLWRQNQLHPGRMSQLKAVGITLDVMSAN